MSLSDRVLLLADGVGVLAFAATLALLWRFKPKVRNAAAFFAVWAAVFLFEFYFLGENSYIHMDDEGDHFVPFYHYLVNGHLDGQFGHHIGGGNDVYAALSPSIQLISPELLWFKFFPVWIAILVHKAIIVAVGFWGGYLLCRDTARADVATAVAVGALFTVSTEYLVNVTYSIGAALSFLPLAIWFFVVRSEERHYWRYAVPFAVIAAIYLDPTHVTEPMFAAIALAAVMLGRINLRVAGAMGLLLIAQLINWGEPIYAIMTMAPLTERGGRFAHQAFSTATLWEGIWIFYQRAIENRINLAILVALVILWAKGDNLRGRGTFAFVAMFVLFVVAKLFPWQTIGLAPVNNLSHHYTLLAATGLAVPLIGRAAVAVSTPGSWARRLGSSAGGIIVLSLTVGMLSYFKVYNFANLLYHGGQSQYHSIGTLADTSWRLLAPSRTLTLRVRDLGPEPAIPYGFYGLESFDVFLMMRPSAWTTFYGRGVLRQPAAERNVDARVMVEWSRWRDGLYRGIGEQLSLPLLRLANVGFLLSPLPMQEEGLRHVAGPPSPPMTREARSRDLFAYMKDRIDRLFDFTDLYVYALPEPYPQVFAADRIVGVGDALDEAAFMRAIEREMAGPGRVVVVRDSKRAKLGEARNSLTVESFARAGDAFSARLDAPEGGIVVVNTVALPFWRAVADARRLEIVPVNQIQMAVRVPAGAREVRFVYHRPGLYESIAAFVSRIFVDRRDRQP